MQKASKENNYYYDTFLTKYAHENRKTLTKSAVYMWKYILSKKQMRGYKFRRERPILNYIADFACLELLLVIEVDGITHHNDEAKERDERKDRKLAEIGFTVLRFDGFKVLNNLKEVRKEIENWIDQNAEVPPFESWLKKKKPSK